MHLSRIRSMKSHLTRLAAAALLILPLVLLTGAGLPGPADDAPDYNYVGVAGCQMCHRSPAKGNQFGAWQERQHSKAYATLASAQSKEIAAAKGIADPQKAEACLKCHVTAAALPAARKAATYKVEDGVGCESCHGPGSAFKAITVMRDPAQARANGLWDIKEETCKGCHNPESPTYIEFNYAEALKIVAHPDPSK
jgi:hypothetical protein